MINKIIIYCVFVTTVIAYKSYDSHKVYSVIPKTVKDVEIIKAIESSGLGALWEDHVAINYDVKIMVSKENQKVFKNKLDDAGIESKEIIDDVQRYVSNIIESN